MMDASKFGMIAAIAAVVALAGCQSQPYNNSRPSQPGGQFGSLPPRAQSAFDGDWLSTDGVAISRFTTGSFETLATDTGNKLAEGHYTQVDASTVSISVTSLIRQTTTQVNCAMVTPTQLNCTSSAGQQFSLTRRATMSS
jgi:hypothetical protein